jgi:hypothetical protein
LWGEGDRRQETGDIQELQEFRSCRIGEPSRFYGRILEISSTDGQFHKAKRALLPGCHRLLKLTFRILQLLNSCNS